MPGAERRYTHISFEGDLVKEAHDCLVPFFLFYVLGEIPWVVCGSLVVSVTDAWRGKCRQSDCGHNFGGVSQILLN